MENSGNIEQKITVRISDIMNKVKTKEDMINIMRERGKKYNYNIRFIFP